VKEKAQNFQDLQVWQKAHELVLQVYRITAGFPKEELFGLTSQMRRSAVSVPANIAEGFKRKGKRDKARFMNIAQASLEETRYYFILAEQLQFSQMQESLLLLDEVSKMLDAYYRAILTSTAKE
jgi:four helix bundle protein